LDEEKSKHAGLAQETGYWLSTMYKFALASKKAQQRCAPAEQSVVNVI
jgi:hypothetical protein